MQRVKQGEVPSQAETDPHDNRDGERFFIGDSAVLTNFIFPEESTGVAPLCVKHLAVNHPAIAIHHFFRTANDNDEGRNNA